ncbi:hypothetical protein [Iodobacter fluviatilis]|uniref:Uncharacterized protein n=1 Tax=Iodobacter fluviatilis TaxID=537 RepID=A0A377Q5L6_9NEIS|nr:hypothetical protein [Iodobacter fluviatilis]TCU84544.1 hypothetical protein EV682_10969 [Iodobacter fluviatilis]STQ90010.1 Uncharacterised protein [Iodobacter fluviatilis]
MNPDQKKQLLLGLLKWASVFLLPFIWPLLRGKYKLGFILLIASSFGFLVIAATSFFGIYYAFFYKETRSINGTNHRDNYDDNINISRNSKRKTVNS